MLIATKKKKEKERTGSLDPKVFGSTPGHGQACPGRADCATGSTASAHCRRSTMMIHKVKV
jgi:hypothetical protein